MENKFLIDLQIKFGLTDDQLSKIVNIAYQLDYSDPEHADFQKLMAFVCENKLTSMPNQQLIEELKRKGFGPQESQS